MKSPRSPPHTPSGSGLGAASPEISLQAQKKRISRRARRGLGPLDPLRINFPEALEQVLREEIKIGDEKDLELRSHRSAAPSPEPPPGLEWKDIKIEVLKSQGLHEPCNEKVTLAKTGSLPPINTEQREVSGQTFNTQADTKDSAGLDKCGERWYDRYEMINSEGEEH